MERANEKNKAKLNLNRALTQIADLDVNVKEELKENRNNLTKYIEKMDKKIKNDDKHSEK